MRTWVTQRPSLAASSDWATVQGSALRASPVAVGQGVQVVGISEPDLAERHSKVKSVANGTAILMNTSSAAAALSSSGNVDSMSAQSTSPLQSLSTPSSQTSV